MKYAVERPLDFMESSASRKVRRRQHFMSSSFRSRYVFAWESTPKYDCSDCSNEVWVIAPIEHSFVFCCSFAKIRCFVFVRSTRCVGKIT